MWYDGYMICDYGACVCLFCVCVCLIFVRWIFAITVVTLWIHNVIITRQHNKRSYKQVIYIIEVLLTFRPFQHTKPNTIHTIPLLWATFNRWNNFINIWTLWVVYIETIQFIYSVHCHSNKTSYKSYCHWTWELS